MGIEEIFLRAGRNMRGEYEEQERITREENGRDIVYVFFFFTANLDFIFNASTSIFLEEGTWDSVGGIMSKVTMYVSKVVIKNISTENY